MQTYQIDTHISPEGLVSLSSIPDLHNKWVRLVIVPIEEKKANDSVTETPEDMPEFVREYSEKLKTLSSEAAERLKKENPMLEFLRKCSGLSEKDFLAGATDNRQESPKDALRYEYLQKKYGIGGTYTKAEVDDARYSYLMEKHK